MKTSIDKKCKYVNAIVGSMKHPLTKPTEWYYRRLKQWCMSSCEYYFFIEHNKDLNEQGEVKFRHIHLVLYLNNSQTRLLTTLNALSTICEIDTLAIQVDKLVDRSGAIQYLIHKNDLNKAQYTIDQIITNLPCQELETIMNTQEEHMSATYLVDVVKLHKGNKLAILKHIGLGYYHMYRQVINDIIADLYIYN